MAHQVVKDNMGFIWIATFHGLYRYDGFQFKPYKSDMLKPAFLPNNNVISLAVDAKDQLWIGTNAGVGRLNLRTGVMDTFKIGVQRANQRVNDIHISKNGRVWLGMSHAFAYFDDHLGKLVQVEGPNGEELLGIEQICEDSDGDIIAATWAKGLFRYNPTTREITHYPSVDGTSSFMSIYKDSKSHLWAGSYGGGLLELIFSKDKKRVSAHHYIHSNSANSLPSDNVYSIGEDKAGRLWFGTLNGISIMREHGVFINYNETVPFKSLKATEIKSFYCDQNGIMWVSTKGAGVLYTSNKRQLFSNIVSQGDNPYPDIIQSVCLTPDGALWIGSNYGALYKKGNTTINLLPNYGPTHIYYSPKTGHVFITADRDGIFECKDGKVLRNYSSNHDGFVPSGMTTMTIVDKRGNLWASSVKGLGVRYADGREYRLVDVASLKEVHKKSFVALAEDHDGSIWAASEEDGVYHLFGDMSHPERIKIKVYDIKSMSSPTNTPLCLFLDRHHQLWMGGNGCGLCLYDRSKDRFITVHRRFNLPGDMASSITEDSYGRLWIGTNLGLACLTISGRDKGRMQVYTTRDGLVDNFFMQNAVSSYGNKLIFGTSRGAVLLAAPKDMKKGNQQLAAITDILIDGQPLDSLYEKKRLHIATVTPSYVKRLVIPASVNSFTILFSSLNFSEPQQVNYAYRLVGFDKSWQMTSFSNRQAHYTNIEPGSYTFEVKATDEYGNWGPVRSVKVVVAPPLLCHMVGISYLCHYFSFCYL